jgi:hypothetical protein
MYKVLLEENARHKIFLNHCELKDKIMKQDIIITKLIKEINNLKKNGLKYVKY